MPTLVSRSSVTKARQLRRAMTDGERRLWAELKAFRTDFGIHVRKQAPIGPFVVDFVVQGHRLIIEVDGEHHFTPEGMRTDARRDAWLAGIGYRILRLNTGDLSNSFDGCVEEIMHALGLMEDSPNPVLVPAPERHRSAGEA